ncbi:MAG: proteasome assembly chaperone family protein [Candidatus Diapherotrites archaeon]|nr:proteasome assembly chaperone family protein [Candidatus Diapherotrites archaeon]
MAEKELLVEIVTTNPENVEGYTLVEGFPGIGLIGTIAVGYLAERQKTKQMGYLMSRHFPPMASIHKGEPLFPARIYVDHQHKTVLLFSEFVVPASTVYDIADQIIKWAKDNKIKRIISLAGMTSRQKSNEPPVESEIYGIASTPTMLKDLEKQKVKVITEGVTTGVSGILMAKCNAIKFPAMSLLIETEHGYPDPGAAAELLEKLEKFLGYDIKTADLLTEAKEIEGKMKKMLSQIKLGKLRYKEAEEKTPMYG